MPHPGRARARLARAQPAFSAAQVGAQPGTGRRKGRAGRAPAATRRRPFGLKGAFILKRRGGARSARAAPRRGAPALHPADAVETALDTTARASAPAPPPLRRPPAGTGDSARLRAWLEAGLHDGRAGALEASQPLALAAGSGAVHLWTEHDGRPASHALARVATVEAAGRRLALGMIGLVYTHPTLRGRGLASRVVLAAAEHLAAGGACVAALWSDRPDFYRRLGFAPGGRERHLRMESDALRAARDAAPRAPAVRVGPPAPHEAAACEALHAAKPVRVARSPGELARALASPCGRVALARRGGRVEAYAALGRGDDFAGVIHEWAGSPDGVLACAAALCGKPGEQVVLACTVHERWAVPRELLMEEGTLYPALHRREGEGWVEAEWGLSENNRRAKCYSLTGEGRARLERESGVWSRFSSAVEKALSAEAANP